MFCLPHVAPRPAHITLSSCPTFLSPPLSLTSDPTLYYVCMLNFVLIRCMQFYSICLFVFNLTPTLLSIPHLIHHQTFSFITTPSTVSAFASTFLHHHYLFTTKTFSINKTFFPLCSYVFLSCHVHVMFACLMSCSVHTWYMT